MSGQEPGFFERLGRRYALQTIGVLLTSPIWCIGLFIMSWAEARHFTLLAIAGAAMAVITMVAGATYMRIRHGKDAQSENGGNNHERQV